MTLQSKCTLWTKFEKNTNNLIGYIYTQKYEYNGLGYIFDQSI